MHSKMPGRRHRHQRIRQRVIGRPDRPRLAVFRSHKHIYAQLVDDLSRRTLLTASSLDEALRTGLKRGGDVEAAKRVGTLVAEQAKRRGVTQVVFDRGGYLYHGRIKALADAARAAGLQF